MQVFTDIYLNEKTSNNAGQTPLTKQIAGSVEAETGAGTVHQPQTSTSTNTMRPLGFHLKTPVTETGTTKAHLRIWKQLELTLKELAEKGLDKDGSRILVAHLCFKMGFQAKILTY